MAETQDYIEVTEAGGKSKKLLIIIVAVVVLALAGAGAMMFLGGDEEASSDDAQTSEGAADNDAAAATTGKQPPIYFAIEKPLVVNFSVQSRDAVRYLSVKLKVMARDQTVIDAFTLNQPAIQHELLLLLFNQQYDALNTTEGTKELQKQTLITINEVLKAEKSSGEIKSVYFTSFLME